MKNRELILCVVTLILVGVSAFFIINGAKSSDLDKVVLGEGSLSVQDVGNVRQQGSPEQLDRVEQGESHAEQNTTEGEEYDKIRTVLSSWIDLKGFGSGHPLFKKLIKELEGIDPGRMLSILEEFQDVDEYNRASQVYVAILAQTSPTEALNFAMSAPADMQSKLTSVILNQWIRKAPEDAIRWFVDHQEDESIPLGSARRNGRGMSLTSKLMAAGRRDIAVDFLNRANGEDLRRNIAIAIVRGLGEQEIRQLISLSSEIDLNAKELLVEEGGRLLSDGLGGRTIESAIEWGATLPDEVRNAANRGIAFEWMKRDPRPAADWWLSQIVQPSSNDFADVVKTWSERDPHGCGEWLAAQPQGTELDAARATFARSLVERDSEAAGAWAAAIMDDGLRELVIQEISR